MEDDDWKPEYLGQPRPPKDRSTNAKRFVTREMYEMRMRQPNYGEVLGGGLSTGKLGALKDPRKRGTLGSL